MKYYPSWTHNDSVAFRRRQHQRMKQCEKIRNINATITTLNDMGVLAKEVENLCASFAGHGPVESEVLENSVFG